MKFYQKYRNVLMEFLLIKFKYRFEKGDFDKAIKKFLDADIEDTCLIECNVYLKPNDIIIMRLLAGGELDNKLIENIKKLWDKEREK